MPGSAGAKKMIGRSVSMGKHDLSERVNRIWLRVTEGMQLNQLWSQFRADAHSGYRLDFAQVESTRVEGVDPPRHFLSLGSQFFWAIVEKLTPARRVLL